MAAITLYGLKTCDTCRKALKALTEAGHDATFQDVRADGVTMAQLKEWSTAFGWEKLLNKASTTWRALDDAEKENVTEKSALDLIKEHPTLMKRPVIETSSGAYLGWKKDVQDEIFS